MAFMPWKRTDGMTEKERFAVLAQTGRFTASELCKELDAFLDNSRVGEINIDSETSEFYATIYRALRTKGKPIPTNDMWIAASALQHGLALCSLDAHFHNIDGIILEHPVSDEEWEKRGSSWEKENLQLST
jgi:predicted nucleic acid-binding protein